MTRTATGYQQQAKLLKALAHPIRLQILDILAKGEFCVCHLTTVLKRRQPYISQHLMVLREAGLVQDRKDGLIVYYRLVNKNLAQVTSLPREILQAAGTRADFPPVPMPPLDDCPCPMCQDRIARGE
jgi:DNA-binding transcriptional ArsR family regulator